MKIFVFGTSQFAELLSCFLWNDKSDVGGYIVDREYLDKCPSLEKVISWDDFIESTKPSECIVYIAIGYNLMNQIREIIYKRLKYYGYNVGTYIHPSSIISSGAILGEGSIVLENVTIQPFVKCGVCNVFWSNVNICHHTKIGDFNFFAASSVVLGRVNIGDKCFFGCNSTIKNEICIGNKTLIGAGAYCSHDTNEYSTVLPARSVHINKQSTELKI